MWWSERVGLNTLKQCQYKYLHKTNGNNKVSSWAVFRSPSAPGLWWHASLIFSPYLGGCWARLWSECYGCGRHTPPTQPRPSPRCWHPHHQVSGLHIILIITVITCQYVCSHDGVKKEAKNIVSCFDKFIWIGSFKGTNHYQLPHTYQHPLMTCKILVSFMF